MEATALTRSCSLRALTSPRAGQPCRAARVSLTAAPPKGETKPRFEPLRRAVSEEDLVGSVPGSARSARLRSPRLVEEEEMVEESLDGGMGMGKGKKVGGGGGGKGGDDGGGGRSESGRRMGEYYRSMLRSDPANPLLLRNYAKYLHEVEGDLKGAEENYARAILANPCDGEVLSLYGRVVWEAHRQKERAAAYLERAVEAAPDDCYVLGSYASFLWDAEEEEEEEEEEKGAVAASRPLVAAF